ncbi:MAG: hypothetical protein HWN65_19500 [Candidatus Helarchaeota archaeon]|nr:hypothetical protein [Candidatus Helarchaeota archaeon]
MSSSFPQFEKYCEECKKYFVTKKVEIEKCPFCGSFLKAILICKTCKRRYSVYVIESDAKCLTCQVPLKLKYRS